MRRVILIMLILLMAFSTAGCSTVKDILGEEKYDKLTGKLSAAWEKVGKDTLASLTDDAWREFGFGKSLDWPTDRLASSLPKLRDGNIEYSYSSGGGGYIKLSGVTDAELNEYLEKLYDIGYRKTVETKPFSVLVTFDGAYVGFIKSGKNECSVIYAESFSLLNEIVAHGDNMD